MVAAIGSPCKLFDYTRVSHADCLVCIVGRALLIMGRMDVTVVGWRLISSVIGSISSQEELSWDSSSSVPSYSYAAIVASSVALHLLDTTTISLCVMFPSSYIMK